MSLKFQRNDVPTASLDSIREGLKAGGLVVLHGRRGSGRTYVAERALEGLEPLKLNINGRPWRHAELLAQAATQLDSRALLEKQVESGPEAAIAQLDELTRDRAVLVDDGDALLRVERAERDWTEAVPGMLAPLDRAWWEWLRQRRAPTLLVARHSATSEDVVSIRHSHDANQWTVKLLSAQEGFRNWSGLVDLLHAHPGKIDLAVAAAPYLAADEFNQLVDEEDSVVSRLASMFRQRAGRMVQALDIIAALDGVPESVAHTALAHGLHRHESDAGAWLSSLDDLLGNLVDQRLARRVAGRIEVSRAAVSFGFANPLPPNRAARLAERLAARVNDLRSLEPSDAAAVLAVHALAIAGGREDLARSTALLHAAGLVDLARQASLDERYGEAFSQYELVRRMLDSSPLVECSSLERVRSYVHHYRAWNGRRTNPPISLANALSDAECAVDLWPENARWQGQKIELLLRLGRYADARHSVIDAEGSVADHPQRARHIRVRPALVALALGQPQIALKLLDPASPQPGWADDPGALAGAKRVLGALRNGVSVSTLDAGGPTLVFRRPITLRVSYSGGPQEWRATAAELYQTRTAPDPAAAVQALAAELRSEAKRLIQTPTGALTEPLADRKGLVLAWTDVLNSDLGLDVRSERWLLGRIEANHFVPVQRDDFAAIPLTNDLQGGPGLWFGRVPVHGDGHPRGAVEELRAAGSSRSSSDLSQALKRLRDAG